MPVDEEVGRGLRRRAGEDEVVEVAVQTVDRRDAPGLLRSAAFRQR
jgi:hypothetical protein